MRDGVGPEWQALAELLRYTRVVVLGQRSRAAFARSLGLSNDRVLNDLENAARDNYEHDTLLAIESWYQIDGDVLRAVLGDRFPKHSQPQSRAAVLDVATVRACLDEMQRNLDDMRRKLDALS